MVHSRVLAEDEVGAAEFVHGSLTLVVRIELSIECNAFGDLLSDVDICHFIFYKPLSQLMRVLITIDSN